MAPEENSTSGGESSRRVIVTYRGIPLADEPLLLEPAPDERWFLHFGAPMPVGAIIECASPVVPEMCLTARVVAVTEPRRKARGSEAPKPGMTVDLDGNIAALDAEATQAAESTTAPAADAYADADADAPADRDADTAADADAAAAEAAASSDLSGEEPREGQVAEFVVEAAPPDEAGGPPPELLTLEMKTPDETAERSEPDGSDSPDTPAGDAGSDDSTAEDSSADDDAAKKKKRRRRRKKR